MPLFTGMRFIFSFVPQNCWNGCTKLSGILTINTGNIVYVVKGVVVNYWMDSDKFRQSLLYKRDREKNSRSTRYKICLHQFH